MRRVCSEYGECIGEGLTLVCEVVVVFFYGYGDHRDLHRVDRRQRQMCIRDRILVVRRTGRAAGGTAVLGSARSGGFAMIVLVLGPVSYTHLRAHETVLDLVCRLLLEKKKHEKL